MIGNRKLTWHTELTTIHTPRNFQVHLPVQLILNLKMVVFSWASIEELTADVTATKNKWSEQTCRTKYCPAVCVRTSRARGLKIPPHIRWCMDKPLNSLGILS